LRPVRLAYQPPASITFLSEQISHQQSASSTFLSEQISTSHQLNEKVVGVCPQKKSRGLGGPPATTRKLEFACLYRLLPRDSNLLCFCPLQHV
jgi:hypothetical protein